LTVDCPMAADAMPEAVITARKSFIGLPSYSNRWHGDKVAD
jgi:hypothetical protein